MESYIFSASDQLVHVASVSLLAMEASCDEYFQVVLESDDELKLLLCLLGVKSVKETTLLSHESFSAVFDYSGDRLPHLDKEGFDTFYEEWLRSSGRDTNMDEYGQLLFLHGRGSSWNKKCNRFVLREKTKA